MYIQVLPPSSSFSIFIPIFSFLSLHPQTVRKLTLDVTLSHFYYSFRYQSGRYIDSLHLFFSLSVGENFTPFEFSDSLPRISRTAFQTASSNNLHTTFSFDVFLTFHFHIIFPYLHPFFITDIIMHLLNETISSFFP